MAAWSVPPEWKGETAYIVAGGPSVAQQNLELLRGRKVVAVNTSWEAVPWAAFLFFADLRWWQANAVRVGTFAGRIVTCSKIAVAPGLLHLDKIRPPPVLAAKPHQVAMQRTSLAGGIGLLVHAGVARIVLLGADMKAAPDGRTHHHRTHGWPAKPGCWDKQLLELKAMAPALAERSIEVINTSLESRIDWWPKRPLADCL